MFPLPHIKAVANITHVFNDKNILQNLTGISYSFCLFTYTGQKYYITFVSQCIKIYHENI